MKLSLWVDIVNISCYKPVNLVSRATFGVLWVSVVPPVVIEAELAGSLGPHRDEDDEDE